MHTFSRTLPLLLLSSLFSLSSAIFARNAVDSQVPPLVRPGPAPAVTLLSMGDMQGGIETCSCGGDFGGLSRWLAYDRMFRETYPDTKVIWLDTGGMYIGGSTVSDLKMGALLHGYHLVSMSAAHLAEREIYQGLGSFQQWIQEMPIPMVSTNIWKRRPEEPLVNPYLIRKMVIPAGNGGGKPDKFRIAILGLNKLPKWPSYSMHAAQFLIKDPAEALAFALEEIEGKADYVVVLAFLRVIEARKLAGQVDGIDLILGAWGGTTGGKLVQGRNLIGDTRILYSRRQGIEIGEVRLFPKRDRSGEWTVNSTMHRVYLTDRYPADPEGEDLMDRTREEIAVWAEENQTDSPSRSGKP